MASKIFRRPVFNLDEIVSMVGLNKESEILEEEENIVSILDWDMWLNFEVARDNPTLDTEE